MENAVDALKMAAAILIFIIAIGSSFSLFGTAKQTADSIITMRDKQAYLEAAELDNGILYTSSSAIQGTTDELTGAQKKEVSSISGVTKKGDRIVSIDDIIFTIYRYEVENYAVTIIKESGEVIARYDTSTESSSYITRWNAKDENNNPVISNENKEELTNELKAKLVNEYVTGEIDLKLEEIYKLSDGTVGAPWLSSSDSIKQRINLDISGEEGKINGTTSYTGEGLLSQLQGKTVVEVINEIDETDYLEDIDENGNKIDTNLPQQYNMPTVEIIYIILD